MFVYIVVRLGLSLRTLKAGLAIGLGNRDFSFSRMCSFSTLLTEMGKGYQPDRLVQNKYLGW